MKIAVYVKLFAKQSKLEPVEVLEGLQGSEQLFTAYLMSAPIDGKANSELIELVSQYFKVRKSQITITSWSTSKHKIIDIRS